MITEKACRACQALAEKHLTRGRVRTAVSRRRATHRGQSVLVTCGKVGIGVATKSQLLTPNCLPSFLLSLPPPFRRDSAADLLLQTSCLVRRRSDFGEKDMFVDKFVSLWPFMRVNFAFEERVRETIALLNLVFGRLEIGTGFWRKSCRHA